MLLSLSHDGIQQPSSSRTIYQYVFVFLLYTYIRVRACVYVRAVRSRWKNTDHFLAFSHGRRHFTDIFHPSPPIPFSPASRFATRGVDRPGMQSTFQGRGDRYVIYRFVSANRDRGCDPSAGNWQWNSLRARGAFITYRFPNAGASIFRSVCYQSQPLRSSITPPASFIEIAEGTDTCVHYFIRE